MEKQYGHIQRLCAIVFPGLLKMIPVLLMVSGVGAMSEGSHVTPLPGEVLVNCYLTEDVWQTKHGFVIRGPSNSGDDLRVTVFGCDWLEDNPDIPDCTSHYGFTLVYLGKDCVVASVPRTLQDNSYQCMLVPQDEDKPFTTCLVIPSGANGDHSWILVVALSITATILLLVVLYMTFFLRHKIYRSKSQYMPVSPDEDEVLQKVTSQVGGAGDAGGQQQRGSNLPEDIWLKDIDDMYPNLQRQAYFLPPYHFNRVPFTMNVIAGLTARVTAACYEHSQRRAPTSQAQRSRQPASTSQAQRSRQPASTSQAQGSQQVAGTLFSENPSNLQSVNYALSDIVDDQAQQKCLHALQDITGETMMVISQLHIRKYLDNKTNPDPHPRHRDAISQLPTPGDLPLSLVDSECDILVIHPDHGLLVAEVRSVGRKPSFSDDHIIVRIVEKAIGQLDKLKVVFTHLLKDLPGISITKAVLLPFLHSSQLRSALSSSELLRQKLIACTKSVDVDQAIRRCLCSDDLKQPGLSAWWKEVWSVSCSLRSPQLYKRLVARFCGVAGTVDIPTACPPRVVVRSLGQAVAETGLRYSALILTHDQVELLDKYPAHQYLYLQGPPGTGKTLVLFLAALKSALQGKKVVIVHMPQDVAVAMLLKLQLTSIVGATTAAQLIHLHPCNFRDDDLDVSADVATLRQQFGPDNVHIIVDEVPMSYGDRHFIPWVTAVCKTWPQALLWMAGLMIRDNTADPSVCLPQWVETATLRVSLRSPPTITDHVAQRGGDIDDLTIPRYVTPAVPQYKSGPSVLQLRHTPRVDGHTEGPLQCAVCGDNVASVIRELGVGQAGHVLQYRDVFVLAGHHCPNPCDGNDLVQRLRQHHRLPVHVVEVTVNDDGVMTTPPSADDARQLALAVNNKIVITHMRAVQGLERRVVFVLGEGPGWTDDFIAMSRSLSFLCTISTDY